MKKAVESPSKSGMIFGILALLATKGPMIFKALKALKYAKFLITAVTMSLSAIVYGFAFGSYYFAAGFVLLILIHEYGHVIAMWKKGVHASAPVFIPFLGAAIFAKIPESKDDEAYIGFGGPFIGTIGAIACIALAFMFPAGTFWSTLLHVLGNVALFINLFNMIPARPLDGGRILHPLGSSVVFVGFLFLAGLTVFLSDVFFLLIAFMTLSSMPIRRCVINLSWGIGFLGVAWLVVRDLVGLNTVSILLSILALALVALGVYNLKTAWENRRDTTTAAPLDDAPEPLWIKLKWLTAYVLLLGFIGGAMVWHTDHLPKEVRESGLVKFVHEF